MTAREPFRPSAQDLAMMDLACAQAERGRGWTSPNPLVGAVVVDGAGQVLSTGYHARVGGDHAEVAALRPLGGRAPGATLYVTLEPCNHVGRTGNCCDALLAAGVGRVVVGMRDPNPRVAGGGVERLRAAGVPVDVGVREEVCQEQNRGYLRWVVSGRPHVVLKAAVSLDGFLAPVGGAAPDRPQAPFWLTGEAARRRAHELRAASDAILVGAGTVLADDPLLTVRLPGWQGRPPLRVVLDGALRVPETARLCGPGTLILCSEVALGAQAARAAALRQRGVEIVALPPALAPARPGDVDLGAALDLLGRRDVLTLLVEGGGEVHGALLRAGLAQEAALFVAPLLLGQGVPLARGLRLPAGQALRLREVRSEPLGPDVLVRGRLPGAENPAAPAPAPGGAPGGVHVHRSR